MTQERFLESDKIEAQFRAPFVFCYFDFVGGTWQTPGVEFKGPK